MTAHNTSPPLQAPESHSPRRALSALHDNIVAVVLTMVVLIPLITGTALMNGAGKVIMFEVLGGGLLALVLARVNMAGAGVRLKANITTGPNLPLTALLVVSAISCAFSPYKAFSLMEMMRVGFCALLYFVMVYYLRGKGALQALTDGLLLITAVVSLVGFAQMGAGARNAVDSTFGSHELLGSFLLLMLPMALALGLTERGDDKRQLAAQVVSLLAGACLLMARTRSAWVGGVVSLIALSAMAARYAPVLDEKRAGQRSMLQSLRQRKHLIVVPLLVLGGALGLVVLLSQTGTDLQKRAATLARVGVDDSFQARMNMWQGTLHMAEEKPLLGWGLGTYPVREESFTGSGDTPQQVLAHGTSHSNIAHNFYLQTAAELGIVGLGLYLAVIIAFFVVGLRAMGYLDNGLRKAVLMGSLAAMAGQVVDAFSSPAYNFASVSMFQWLIMGAGMFAAGLGARGRSAEADTAAERVVFSAPAARRLQYAVSALVAVGIVSQITPAITSASATVTQTCTMNGTFRSTISGPTILVATGQSTRVVSTFNEHPTNGNVTYQYVFTNGDASLVNITNDTRTSIRITRTGATAPRGATLTVNTSFTDANGQVYTNFGRIVIQLGNPNPQRSPRPSG